MIFQCFPVSSPHILGCSTGKGRRPRSSVSSLPKTRLSTGCRVLGTTTPPPWPPWGGARSCRSSPAVTSRQMRHWARELRKMEKKRRRMVSSWPETWQICQICQISGRSPVVWKLEGMLVRTKNLRFDTVAFLWFCFAFLWRLRNSLEPWIWMVQNVALRLTILVSGSNFNPVLHGSIFYISLDL